MVKNDEEMFDLQIACAASDIHLALHSRGLTPFDVMSELSKYPGWAKAILLTALEMKREHFSSQK